MSRIRVNIANETSTLKSVVLGLAKSPGETPSIEEAYDPKSIEHIKNNTYPVETDMVLEITTFRDILEKHGVQVYRPDLIEDCNQIFARDIGFVVDEYFFKSNILPNRAEELQAINYIIDKLPQDNVITVPESVHMEGGDVMPWNEHLFIGTYKGSDYPTYITARTNMEAVSFFKSFFPNKKVKEFNLRKSNSNPRENALHLDCVFQPIGKKYGIIHKEGFLDVDDYHYLVNIFGMENLFHISADEMYQMFSNVFSISPEVVVSERNFTRLNDWMRSKGFIVEEIPYAEIAKQEGLLRCSTLPLYRHD